MDPDHERYSEASEARSLIETDHQVKTIFETARGLEGLVRDAGVHACARSSCPASRCCGPKMDFLGLLLGELKSIPGITASRA